MTGAPKTSPTRFRLAGAFLVLLGIATLLVLWGCGDTPRERYERLSVFFDGVPNPDAPKRKSYDDFGHATVAAVHIVSQHKPFIDNQCAACHASASGDIQDFALAYNACVKCHKTIATDHTLMHGPVARAQCKWCHAPHQSTEPHLLKDTPINVCTQCHDKQLLSAFPPEHTDGQTSCLQCHFGHGGTARYFLKSAAAPNTTPATSPATAPADAPPPPATLNLPTPSEQGPSP